MLLRLLGSALVLQVAEGSRQIEPAVHAAVANVASCLSNAVYFYGVLGFVILAKFYSFLILKGNRP